MCRCQRLLLLYNLDTSSNGIYALQKPLDQTITQNVFFKTSNFPIVFLLMSNKVEELVVFLNGFLLTIRTGN